VSNHCAFIAIVVVGGTVAIVVAIVVVVVVVVAVLVCRLFLIVFAFYRSAFIFAFQCCHQP